MDNKSYIGKRSITVAGSPIPIIVLAAMIAASAWSVSRQALAAGGDFAGVDFAASAPFTYDHLTGGGAWDDGTIGKAQDVVESLEGGDFACGEVVSYLYQLQVRQNPADPNQTVEFLASYLGDTTGQSGAAHIAVEKVTVNYGPVQSGDGPGGIDSGILDDGGSSASLVSQYFSPGSGPYIPGTSLFAKVRVDDLEAGERVVVRVDVRIGCRPYAVPTGNLQASLVEVKVVSPYLDIVNAGNQTIPFKQIGSLEGSDEPVLHLYKTVASADGSCPGQEQMTAVSGTEVKYCYQLVNSGTADASNVAINDDNGTSSYTADDFVVALTGLSDLDADGFVDDLAAGASASGFAIVEIDLRSGSMLTNRALASGWYNGTGYSDIDTATVAVEVPPASISLAVIASFDEICGNADDMDPLTVYPGAEVRFCYLITNTGGVAVDGITVEDSVYGFDVPVSESLNLGIGESGTLISGPVVIVEDSADSAIASGYAGSIPVQSNPDSATVLVDFSSVSLSVKASLDPICGNGDDVDLATVLSGTTVYFCYTLLNTGDTIISNPAVVDPAVDGISPYAGEAELLPGEWAVFISEPYIAESDTLRTGTAYGFDGFGFAVESLPDDAFVDVIFPELKIEKTASLDGTCPGIETVYVLSGQTVTWCYEVINTGDTAVFEIVITDGETVLAFGNLEPGQSGIISTQTGIVEDAATSATASGIENALGSKVESEPDAAAADVVHPALTIQTTLSLDGSCPGLEIQNVLEQTGLTWCYQVINTGDVGVAAILVQDSFHGSVPGIIDHLEPGEFAFLMLSEPAEFDVTVNAAAFGTADLVSAPVGSEPDPAAVNVVFPGINIDVTISLDGNCPGQDSVAVPAGTEVRYCYAVTNLGDEPLEEGAVVDSLIGEIGSFGLLESGESITLVSGPVVIDSDRGNEAVVAGNDIFGFPVSDTDTALADALFADIKVVKTAPAKILTTQGTALSYSIAVSNIGQAPAENVVLLDAIPVSTTFVTAYAESGTCAYSGGVVTCSLGTIEPGYQEMVAISVNVGIVNGTIANTATVATSSVDGDLSNNSSTATTRVAPGATRTIGFYSTHPEFVEWCLSASAGQIDLGYTRLANETADDQIDRDRDRDVETGLELAMGVLNANVSRYVDKSKRSPLDQARMQGGRQVLAAICNNTLFGADTSFNLSSAPSVLAGNDINAILTLSSLADTYNNSGDSVDMGVPAGRAVPKYPWDDPTDPAD